MQAMSIEYKMWIVLLVMFVCPSSEAATKDTWHTSVINRDPWVWIDSGRYDQEGIQATTVHVGHQAIEVGTISIDCQNNKLVPNIRYSFVAKRGLEQLEWWQTVSGSISVQVGPSSFAFGRVTYNLGHHPYMISSSDDEEVFMNALAEVGTAITINLQVPADGEARQMAVSMQNYKSLYDMLSNSCTK